MTPITVASRATSNAIPRWKTATWKDYLAYYDDPNLDEVRAIALPFSRQINSGYIWRTLAVHGRDRIR